MEQTFITLNNGRRIPQFGLGVFMVTGDEATRKVCLDAIRLGYRHIDTAHAYQNERGVGQAVRECGVPREDLWITSKLWPSEYGEGKTLAGIDKMLSRLERLISLHTLMISKAKDLDLNRRGLFTVAPRSSLIPYSLLLITFQKSRKQGEERKRE